MIAIACDENWKWSLWLGKRKLEERKAALLTKGSLLDQICALEETIKGKPFKHKSKLNIEWSPDPTVLLLGIYPKEIKTGVQTKTCMWMFIVALFTNTQKVETAQLSISRKWTHQMGCINTMEYLFGYKKEQNSNACYHRGEPWKHDAKLKKLVTKGHLIRFHPSRQIIETESRFVVVRSWGEKRMRSDCLVGTWFLF